MIAIEITQPGGPDVLQPHERPIPKPAAGEILIRTAAAGVSRADLLQRQGKYPPPSGASDIPGLEISGIVEDANGSNWKGGDRVCAILAGGGYAEFVSVPEEQVLPTPDGWTDIEAASLPENLFTSFDNLVIRTGLRGGETVLIHGGTSGLGSMSIMLARKLGCDVLTTVGSDAKCAAALEWGVRAAINYRTQDFALEIKRLTENRGVDVILDMIGGAYFERNLDCLAEEGRLAIVATQGGTSAQLDMRKLMGKRARVIGSTMRARSPQAKGLVRDRLRADIWTDLPSKQFIRPLIDSVFLLREAARAHERMEEGTHIGKIILSCKR